MIKSSPAVRLPSIRSDIANAASDLDEWGFTRICGGCDPSDLAAALQSGAALAKRHREEGRAYGGNAADPNQRVYGVIAEDPSWGRIASSPLILETIHHILGDRIILFSLQYYEVGQGGASVTHIDQMHVKPAIPFSGVASAIVMLDEFTEENGATRVLPGTHRATAAGEEGEVLTAVGPVGTTLVFGGLLKHAVGINRSPAPRRSIVIHYCLPWLQRYENFQHSVTPEMLEQYPPDLRALLAIPDRPYGMMPGLIRSGARGGVS